MENSDRLNSFFEQLAEPFTGEMLFDQLNEIVFFIKDADCRYIRVNQTLVERCGLKDKQQLIGRTTDEIFPAILGQEYRKQDEQVLKQAEPILNQLEMHLYPSGGAGWCITNKVPLYNRQHEVIGLVGISRDIHTPTKVSPVAEVVQYIKKHYAEPLKVEDIAAQTNLSPYQLEQRMLKIFHLTPGQFIQKTRMDAAIWKLKNSDDSIQSISEACGYTDTSAFSRQFKQSIGLTPTQYRKMSQNK